MSGEFADFEETVFIELIDQAIGRSVQAWTFDDTPSITIGGAPQCQVALTDPYVSRDHAELRWFAEQWWIISRGRNGVVIDGKHVVEQVIHSDTYFRLGPQGPQFRFHHRAPEDSSLRTISFDAIGPVQPLTFDAMRLDRDVRQIIEDDYFQRLHQRSKELRGKRGAAVNGTPKTSAKST